MPCLLLVPCNFKVFPVAPPGSTLASTIVAVDKVGSVSGQLSTCPLAKSESITKLPPQVGLTRNNPVQPSSLLSQELKFLFKYMLAVEFQIVVPVIVL